MSKQSVTDIIVRESGRFLPSEIFKRVYGQSPWLSHSCALDEEWSGGRVRWRCQFHGQVGPWLAAHLPNQHTSILLAEQFAVHQVLCRLQGKEMGQEGLVTKGTYPAALSGTMRVITQP